MIELQGVHKSYRTGDQSVHVLKGVDLSIREGELVSIMGSSGSGKSTLLNILGILDSFDEGSYLLAGESVNKMGETQAAQLRNRMLGFVFQSFNLLPFKNATENVALPLYYQGVGRKERNRRAEQILDMVGLAERRHFMPNQLSGGQKQRVAIARALVTKPKVILADEPTGALDSKTTQEIMELLKEIHRLGNTLIIVTHEQDIANQTERQIVLKDGVVASTPRLVVPREVAAPEEMAQ
jgi:putative ABC transport system ATP-binding protein